MNRSKFDRLALGGIAASSDAALSCGEQRWSGTPVSPGAGDVESLRRAMRSPTMRIEMVTRPWMSRGRNPRSSSSNGEFHRPWAK